MSLINFSNLNNLITGLIVISSFLSDPKRLVELYWDNKNTKKKNLSARKVMVKIVS